MIILKMTIEEVPGKGYYIDMNPDQTKATQKEMHAASLFDIAFKMVGEYILKKSKSGGAIESHDIDAIRSLADEMIQRFKLP